MQIKSILVILFNHEIHFETNFMRLVHISGRLYWRKQNFIKIKTNMTSITTREIYGFINHFRILNLKLVCQSQLREERRNPQSSETTTLDCFQKHAFVSFNISNHLKFPGCNFEQQ